MNNRHISFYVDTLLVETVLGDDKLYKKAGIMSDILSKAKTYFEGKIDKEHPVQSVLTELAPGALWAAFSMMGIGKWGMLAGLLMNVLNVDVKGILSSLYQKVKAMIGGGNQVAPEQIDRAVTSTIQEHNTPPNEEEIQKGYQALQAQQSQQANDGKVYSSLELMRDARIIRLALIEYEAQTMRLTKSAIDRGMFSSMFGSAKPKGTSLLATIFGWVIKIVLMSAGLMIAGDLIKHVTGVGEKSGPSSTLSGPVASQTKFRAMSDSPLPSSMPVVNNDSNIENMVLQFAKDVYSGLDGKESLIRNTPGFQMVKEQIINYNSRHPGSSITFIPPSWASKKQMVDYFIDDVAKSAG